MNKNEELMESLNHFQQLLQTQADNAHSIPVFTRYIRSFLRIKPIGRTLPTIEMMTILKKEKPVVWYLLRRHSKDEIISMLVHLDMDYEQAVKKIKRIISGEVLA